ncbi:MAG: hypothetical protein A2Z25_23910 [Planctomycetes bacterium RBG_16_55_9]|nr:MAG: hypothetical protein A2Z25_23910 [Planctomycetes bacterium RBG_16_55_9]
MIFDLPVIFFKFIERAHASVKNWKISIKNADFRFPRKQPGMDLQNGLDFERRYQPFSAGWPSFSKPPARP